MNKSVTALRKKAWKLHSEIVRRKEGGKCYTCGQVKPWKEMQAGHYEHKDCMDFVRKNIHCQCQSCNHFRSGNRNVYAIKLEKQYGHGILQELRKLADENHNYRLLEVKSIIEGYKKEVQSVRGEAQAEHKKA